MFYPERLSGDVDRPDPGHFRRLTRDIYVPAGDTGFWMSAFRDPASDEFVRARTAIAARQALTIDLLYGDFEGGQCSVTRFALLPVGEDGWLTAAGRHWNIDRPQPR